MNTPKTNPFIGILLLILSMMFFQGGAGFATFLMKETGPYGATALRQVFSLVSMIFIARMWKIDFSKIDLKKFLAYGISLGLMNLTFYIAIERIPLGVAVAIEFSGPLFVSLISSRKPLDFVWVLLACVGLYFLMPISQFGAHLDKFGVLCAVLAAIGWAGYIIAGHRLGKDYDGLTAVALGIFVSSLFTVPIGIVNAGAVLFEPKILLFGLALGLLTNAIPYSIEMMALKQLSRQSFSLLMSLEPAFAALAGAIILSQNLGLIQIIAIALIIFATIGSTLSHKDKPVVEELQS